MRCKKKDSKHKIRNIFIGIGLIVVVVLLFAIKSVFQIKFILNIPENGISKSTSSEIEKTGMPSFLIFDTKDSEYIVQNEADALGVIKNISEKYELQNLSTNLGVCQENEIMGLKYYRFLQTYKDIPVYGRNVIVYTDSEAKLQGMSNNYICLNEINITEQISEEEAYDIVKRKYNKEVKISRGIKTVYTLYDTKPTLSWMFYVNDVGVAETCLVNAEMGNVLAVFSDIFTDTGVYKDENGTILFNTKKVDNDTYQLVDEEKNLWVYDSMEMMTQYAMKDENDNFYYYNNSEDEWYDKNGNEVLCTYKKTNEKWMITDSSGYLIGDNAEQIIYTADTSQPVEIVTNDSTHWSNEKAAKAISMVANAYDFFKIVLDRKGYDGNNGQTNIYINDAWDNGNNAYSHLGENCPPTILAFGFNKTLKSDIVGHEFMHSVERVTSGMLYQNESGSLSEALSDIYGELIEDWSSDKKLNDSCDWIHNNRNMIQPSQETIEYCYYVRNGLDCPIYKKYKKHISGKKLKLPSSLSKGCCTIKTPYPDTYQGKNYWVGSDDNGGTHVNNTVISHACYLMTHPQNKTGLTNEELAKLLYNTLGKLMPDCGFNDFATQVRNTAIGMNLSDDKIEVIEEAFEKVGLKLDEIMIVKINEFMPDKSDLGTVRSEGSMTSIIDSKGNLIMCGSNADGQLGSKIPEKKSTYSLISTNIKYACGTSNLAVISKDNKLYVRKYDGNEELPNEKKLDLEMFKVADEVIDVEVWGDVCAYVTNDGELYAMGSPRGSLGDSENTIWSAKPIKIMDNIRDIELSTNYDYGTIFAAITKENELYMWGNNSTGIIKESIEDDVSKPLLIMENAKMVSLGTDYVLVLTMDGIVYAWGNNKNGELGIGSKDEMLDVVKIMENVVHVDAGASSSLAITKNGELYTWGSNDYGCTGTGVNYNEEVERPIAIMQNVRTASIDGETMIILGNDGNVYTCGWNSVGQLGTGDFNDSIVPIKVYNIYESDLPGTISDESGEIVDEKYFDTMDDIEIDVEGSGQNLITHMKIDHLSDFVKYNGGDIKLQLSDGNIALMFSYKIENDVAKPVNSVSILTQNNGNLSWMGTGWHDIKCEQNENTLSWNITLPSGSFTTESIKYIGVTVHTSRCISHESTFEIQESGLSSIDESIEQMDVAVNSWEGYHQYIE